MNIKSSAIDLSLMGTHTFSNEVNYHFSIALADLIAAKFQRKNPGFKKQTDFGPVEDDGRGKTQILVSLTGTVDDPVFAYDRKAAAEKINKELRIQKVELKEAFKKEFGSLSGDTLRKSQKAKEKEMQKKQEEGKFVIDWDDDKRIE
jgi:sugar/nucleoside kinase (ribokinase family)